MYINSNKSLFVKIIICYFFINLFNFYNCCPDCPNIEKVCWSLNTAITVYFNFRNKGVTAGRNIESFSAATYNSSGILQYGPFVIKGGNGGFGGCSGESWITLSGLPTNDNYIVGVWITDTSGVSSSVRCLESANDCIDNSLSNCTSCENDHVCAETSKDGYGIDGTINPLYCYNFPLSNNDIGCAQTSCVQPYSGYNGNELTPCGTQTCNYNC